MNVSNAASFPRISATGLEHRSSKVPEFHKNLEQAAGDPARTDGAKPGEAGKSAQSPAFRARALIAADPTLGDDPFGKLVSTLAKAGKSDPVTDPATGDGGGTDAPVEDPAAV